MRVTTRDDGSSWLNLTEEENALDFLWRACDFIDQAVHDPRAWKWVVLAFHGALYGFAICAIKGTNPDNVTRKRKNGQEHLLGFDEALRLAQSADWMRATNPGFGDPLVLTAMERRAIHKLKNVLRNNFEHYVPRLWSIEVSGMDDICLHCLRVVRFLMFQTATAIVLANERDGIEGRLDRAQSVLSSLRGAGAQGQ